MVGDKGQAYLVAKTLGSNDGDLVTYALVGFEVQSELWVVAFNDDFGRFLDCLNCMLPIKLFGRILEMQFIPLYERDP